MAQQPHHPLAPLLHHLQVAPLHDTHCTILHVYCTVLVCVCVWIAGDCKKAFKLKECEDGERYSEGQTFWMGASATPRCELERLAQGIFAQHTQSTFFDPATSGAEWWTQHIDTIDDIGFHFDRDVSLMSCWFGSVGSTSFVL